LGVEENFAVNVIAPLLLTRALLPALKAGAGKQVQITSGGLPIDTLDVLNLQAGPPYTSPLFGCTLSAFCGVSSSVGWF